MQRTELVRWLRGKSRGRPMGKRCWAGHQKEGYAWRRWVVNTGAQRRRGASEVTAVASWAGRVTGQVAENKNSKDPSLESAR